MKFATAVSVLTASTVAPRCFATVPTQGVSRQQQSHNGNNIRRRIAAATTGGRQKTTKKNRSTRQQQEDKHSQFLRMRSPSTTLKNRGGLDRMAEIRTTTVECDPTSSHADIGILCGSSTSPQSNDLRVSCQEDLNSSLGGFCTEQVPLSRQLEEYISAEDMYYWCNDASYANWNCNCDGWDETNIMGNITECSYQYCSDCDGGNCSEDSFWVYINDTGRVWKVSRL